MKAFQFNEILKRIFLTISLPAFIIVATPSVCGLILLLLITDILRLLNPCKRAVEHQARQPRTDKASIVILNWNGRELLEKSVPSVIEAVRWDGGDHEIIVVDNGSTDDSVAFLRCKYPQVRIIVLDRNYYFSGGCNEGVRRSRNDIVVLLNNDMIVDKEFLRPLLNGFVDDDVFAVSAQIFFWDKDKERVETGKTRGFYRWGFLQVIHDEVNKEGICPILYAGGGSAAFDKAKFIALGGFDDLFDPFYWEDTDLSYRAWKRGWRVLYEPRSVVYHKHRGTNEKVYGQAFVHKMINRNHFLLIWKNINDPLLILLHPVALGGRLLLNYLQGNFTYLAAFSSAVSRMGKVLKKRLSERQSTKLTDKEVLIVSSDLFSYKERFIPRAHPVRQGKKSILFICPYIPCFGVHAGAGRMYTMIKLLARQHQVSVVTFVDKESEFKYVPELEKYCEEVIAIHRRPPYRKRNLWAIEPFVVDEFYSPRMREEIHRLLSTKDFDIVQAEYTQMAQYVPHTRRSCTLVTEHEVAFATHRRAFKTLPTSWGKFRAFMGWLLVLDYEVKACRRCDKIIALTEADKRELLSFDPELDIAVVPMGVDGSYFVPQNAPEEPNSLIFTGYFRHTPNVHGIMRFCKDILPLIREEVPQTKLYIVGSSPPEEIIRLAEGGDVIVTGWVKDMRPYIARCSVFIAPLWLGTGMRGKILEAWGMAKPVVTTAVGSQGIDCTPGEDILIADDPQGFAAHTVRLLKDRELREKLGRNGRKRVEERYDWEMIVQQVEDIYDGVLAHKFGG